jgi:hypothetical protein
MWTVKILKFIVYVSASMEVEKAVRIKKWLAPRKKYKNGNEIKCALRHIKKLIRFLEKRKA